jgi:hypothetical protein
MAYEIVNQNDIFVFFNIIQKMEPDAILDVGMFLQRIGALSRRAISMSFSNQVICDGMPLGDQHVFPVSNTIYQSVCDMDTARSFYSLAFLLGITDMVSPAVEEQLWTFLRTHAHCVVTDCKQPERLLYLQRQGIVTDFTVSGERYAVIIPDAGR